MSRRALLLFAAMCVIWGIPYLFIRIAVTELPPVELVFARTAGGALILIPIALARGELRGLAARWAPLLAFTALEIGIPWLMVSTAEQRISSSLAGLLVAAVPLVGVVVAPLFGNRDRMDAANLTGLLVGMVGVAAIVGFDFHASDALALVQMALLGVVALHERFTVGMAAGFVLVLVGSTLATRRRRAAAPSKTSPAVAFDDHHVAARPDA